jgi:hypothetical protein
MLVRVYEKQVDVFQQDLEVTKDDEEQTVEIGAP